ncbi:substrate-binding domain-containing protein [Oceaniglobus ichthyenteri]|uniref:substrate-binding domain-containing protein n=1 Tax=Oceaniglobus ichthyenteri TaxID=2136177 RepID=UPI000D3C8F1D|nr:substrate-binding domain-containing protein [Oceaniglobus ichthyenteri]
MMILRAAITAVLFFFGTTLWAEDVTLTSRDGSVEVSGNLLGYDGEFFRVDTEFGILTLDGSGVICTGPGCPNLTAYVAEFTLSGAPSMGAVLIPSLLESFAARNGFALRRVTQSDERFLYELSERATGKVSARIGFRLNSSDEGFADLIAEEADIALSLREVTAQEAAIARTGDLGDLTAPGRSRILALDALVPLTALSNPIKQIDMADLAAIFAGELTTWDDLGGAQEPIVLHLRDENSGLSQTFQNKVLAEYGKAGVAADITRHATNESLVDAVARDPFAIGMGSFSDIGNTVSLAVTGPCGFVTAATTTTIKTEDYPLTAPLFVYLPPRRLPRIAREFLHYIGSPAAQPVIRRAGFVDQFPAAIPFENQGARFANAIDRAGGEIDLSELQRLVRTLSGHSRLTVTYRFEGGSTELDAQSRSNVALLAEALERGVFDDRTLVFVGFSDGEGPASINRRISRTRARAVRDAVRAAAHTVDPARLTLRTEAFGEAMPMACDEVEWGRGVNRRVEVWLK